jgi:PadR family transcriptional regulator, regulatory protein AphA
LSLKYGLLGYLSYGPQTGYDMHKMYPKPLRPTIGFIYRTLIAMTKEGLVESTRVNQEKRPDRNLFSITEAGRVELVKWLTTPLHFSIPRNTLLVQLAFGKIAGKEAMLNDIRSHRDEVKSKLVLFRDQRQWGPILKKKRSTHTIEDPYRQIVYESVLDILNYQVEWLDSMEKKVSQVKE